MKINTPSPARRAALLVVGALGMSAGALCLPAFTPAAQAAPKSLMEIWPGQRVILVLPLTIGPDWNGGPELAEAIKPLVRPELQTALANTNKFSVTSPYRFDPILRRALVENRLSQDVITPFVATPSLETAQPVFTTLKFDQVPMATQVQLEELRVGGDAKKPTAQLQVSAKLYEIGVGTPFRSIVVTSDPAQGRTPEERLQNAAADAFKQIATYFVKAPDSFQLTSSLTVASDAAKAGSAPIVRAPQVTTPQATTPQATTPAIRSSTYGGTAMIPVLPVGEPPLGVIPGNEKTLSR